MCVCVRVCVAFLHCNVEASNELNSTGLGRPQQASNASEVQNAEAGQERYSLSGTEKVSVNRSCNWNKSYSEELVRGTT